MALSFIKALQSSYQSLTASAFYFAPFKHEPKFCLEGRCFVPLLQSPDAMKPLILYPLLLKTLEIITTERAPKITDMTLEHADNRLQYTYLSTNDGHCQSGYQDT